MTVACGVAPMFSIILGILASVLPNLLFYWFYIFIKAKTPIWFVRFFYLNEGIKFAVLALLVSAFFQWQNLHFIEFFIAFLLCELARLLFQSFYFKGATLK